jgi:hypothetical protein
MFEKRRNLMQQWEAFCTNALVQIRKSSVTPLRA